MPVLQSQFPVVSPLATETALRSAGHRAVCVHALRLLLILALIATLRTGEAQRRRAAIAAAQTVERLPQSLLQQWYGTAAVEQRLIENGRVMQILDQEGSLLGRVVETFPEAAAVRGYRGSSHLIVGLDSQARIVGVHLVSSQDTQDHVAAIHQSPTFFAQFQGRTVDQLYDSFDGVSGATLTALAIRDSVAMRLGVKLPASSRFPAPITLAEASQIFPEAKQLVEIPGTGAESVVKDSLGEITGTVARTGVLEDQISGYQGPTELLLGFDTTGKLKAIEVRQSFDNQPYVSYLDDEPWYWEPFLGQTWQELASLDWEELRIEGVSGATMTSVAAAEVVLSAAGKRIEEINRAAPSSPAIAVRWSAKDAWTAVIVGATFLLTARWLPGPLRRIRGRKAWRPIWQWVVIIGFGFLTGNVLSLALLISSSVGGLAWTLAPGISLVVLVALAASLFSKTPFYCSHLCPHGALQQQIKHLSPSGWRLELPGWLRKTLLTIPVSLFVLAYWVTLIGWDWNLAAWEPFDAYLWWVGAGGSIGLFVVSLLFCVVQPMGYCRYGCPTGWFLSYLRWNRQRGSWTRVDLVACVLLLTSWLWLLQV